MCGGGVLGIGIKGYLLMSLVAFMVECFCTGICLKFRGDLIAVARKMHSRVCFKKVLVSRSFSLVSLSFFTVLFVLRVYCLAVSLFGSTGSGVMVLLPHCKGGRVVCGSVLVGVVLHSYVMIISSCLFFLFMRRASGNLRSFGIVFVLLVRVFRLRVVDCLFSF